MKKDNFPFLIKSSLLMLLGATGFSLISFFLPDVEGFPSRVMAAFSSDLGHLLLNLHKGFADSLLFFSFSVVAIKALKRELPIYEACFLLVLFSLYLVALRMEWFAMAFWEPMNTAGVEGLGPFPWKVHMLRAGFRHYVFYPAILILILRLALKKEKAQ